MPDGWLAHSLDPQQTLQDIAELAAVLMGAQVVVFWTAEESRRILDLEASWRAPGISEFPLTRLTYEDGGGVGWVATHRSPLSVADVFADRRIVALDWWRANDLRSFLAHPVLDGDVLQGVIGFSAHAAFACGSAIDRRLGQFIGRATVRIRNARLYADSERRRREAEALAAIGQVLTSTLDVASAGRAIVDGVQGLLRAGSAALYLVDGESGDLKVHTESRTVVGPPWPRLMKPGMGASGLALRERQAVFVSDRLTDPRLTYSPEVRARLAGIRNRALLSVPLIVRSRPLGVLNITDTVGRRFEPGDVALAGAFGQQAALALENARLFEAEVARRKQSELFGKVARSLLTEHRSDPVLHRLADEIAHAFHGGVGIWLVEGEWLVERLRSAGGVVAAGRLRFGEGITGVCATRRACVLVNDYPMWPHAVRPYVEVGFRHAMAQPMLVGDELLGVVSVARYGDDAEPFVGEDLASLERLAELASLALRNVTLYEEAEQRRQEAEALASHSRALPESLDPSAVARQTVERVRALLRTPVAALYRLDEASGVLIALASVGTLGSAFAPETMLPPGTSVAGLAVRDRAPAVTPDLLSDERITLTPELRRRIEEGGDFRASVSVPVLVEGRVFGALTVADRIPRTYAAGDVRLLEAFAAAAALALQNAELHTETEVRRRDAEITARGSRALHEAGTALAIAERFSEIACEVAGCVAAAVFEVEKSHATWSLIGGHPAQLYAHVPAGTALPVIRGMLSHRVSCDGEVRWSPDVFADPRYPAPEPNRRIWEAMRVGAILAVPIRLDARVIAMLNCYDRSGRTFSDREIALVQALANDAALALERVRLQEETERRRREAEELARVAQMIAAPVDVLAVAAHIVDSVVRLFSAGVVAVFRLEPDASMTMLACHGIQHGMSVGQRLLPGGGLLERAIAEGRVCWSPDVLNDPTITYSVERRQLVEAHGHTAALSFPLIIGERTIGAMQLGFEDRTALSDGDLALAGAFAHHAALALDRARLFEDTTRRRHEAEALAHLARALANVLDVAQVGDRLARNFRALFGSAVTTVGMLAPDGSLRIVAADGPPLGAFPLGQVVDPSLGIIGLALAERELVWTSDILTDTRVTLDAERRRHLVQHERKAMLAVPLRFGDHVFGVLAAAYQDHRSFSPDECALAQTFADQAAVALENTRLHEEAERRRENAEVVAGIARSVNRSLDVGVVLRQVVEAARILCRSDLARIALRDPQSGAMAFRYWVNARYDYASTRIWPGTGSLGGLVLKTGEPMRTEEWLSDPRFSKEMARVIEVEGIVTLMAVPIRIEDQVAGLLYVDNRTRQPFTDRDEVALLQLADQAAIAIQNAQLFEESSARRRSAEAVMELGRTLGETLDPSVVAQRTVTSARALLGSGNAVLYSLDEAGALRALAVSGEVGSHDELVSPPGRGVSGVVVREGRPVTTRDLLTDERVTLTDDQRQRFEQTGYRAVLGVPLVLGDHVIGTLSVADRPGRVFDQDEVRAMQTFATQVVLALENARLYSEADGRRREAELLASIAQNINASLDVDAILKQVADGARALCNGDLAYVALRDVRGGYAVRHWAPARADADEVRIFPEDLATIVAAEGIIGQLTVPIGTGDAIEGVLSVANREPRSFTDQDEAALVRLAEHAAVALHNATLFMQRSEAEAAVRESERRYRLLAENAADVISVFDLDLKMTYVSLSNVRLSGYTPEEGMHRSILSVLSPSSREILTRAFADDTAIEASGTGDPNRSVTLELELRHKNGSMVWTETRLTSLRDETGRRVSFLAVSRDITARKRAEETLRTRDAELQQAQKMDAIGQLAGGIAHDFNNLLTIIGGRAEFALLHPTIPAAVQQDVELIQATAERAALLTRQLLAFSRRQVLLPRRLDLNVVIDGFVPMLRRLIGEHVDIEFVRDPVGTSIMADRGQLEQVLLNLAVNARDAMPHGGRLVLRTSNVVWDRPAAQARWGREPGRYVLLAVSDTGVGMDAGVRAHIFEPFFTTKPLGKGTGLGLATVYGIIKQSGGEIAVESEPGHGTTFTICFPHVEPGAETKGLADPMALVGGTETILLVEDEAELRRLTSAMLTRVGYTVLEASRPSEAHRLVEQLDREVSLVITDVVMPELSGPELVRQLRASLRGLKVLYISGYANVPGDVELDAPLLPKPFSTRDLLRIVRGILDAAAPRE